MKTKSIVLALVMGFVSVAAVAADPVAPKMVVINQKDGGIFKVIYAGTQVGKISLNIYDAANRLVFTETVNGVEGFIRPVNFSAMEAGAYTIEVSDASGKQIQKIDYKKADKNVNSIHLAKVGNDNKYLLAIANTNEVINVRIFDGSNTLVHNQDVTVAGNYGMIYNLKNVIGTPTFEVTNQAGTTKVVRY
jgi:hypothetical protein